MFLLTWTIIWTRLPQKAGNTGECSLKFKSCLYPYFLDSSYQGDLKSDCTKAKGSHTICSREYSIFAFVIESFTNLKNFEPLLYFTETCIAKPDVLSMILLETEWPDNVFLYIAVETHREINAPENAEKRQLHLKQGLQWDHNLIITWSIAMYNRILY